MLCSFISSRYAEMAPLAALEAANPGLDSITYRYTDKYAKKRVDAYIELMEVLVENLLNEITAFTSPNCSAVEKFMGVSNLTKIENGLYSGVKFDYKIDWRSCAKRDGFYKVPFLYVEHKDEAIFATTLKNKDVLYIYSGTEENGQMRTAAKELQKIFHSKTKKKCNLLVPSFFQNSRYSFRKYSGIAATIEDETYRFSDVYLSFSLGFEDRCFRSSRPPKRDVLELETSCFLWVKRSPLPDPLFTANILF